jgi:hypothetical protein
MTTASRAQMMPRTMAAMSPPLLELEVAVLALARSLAPTLAGTVTVTLEWDDAGLLAGMVVRGAAERTADVVETAGGRESTAEEGRMEGVGGLAAAEERGGATGSADERTCARTTASTRRATRSMAREVTRREGRKEERRGKRGGRVVKEGGGMRRVGEW